MKNKALKNLIVIGAFVVTVFFAQSASAALYYDGLYYDGSSYGENNPTRQDLLVQQYNYQQTQLQMQNEINTQKYYNEQQKLTQEQNLLLQKQNIALNTNNSVNGGTYSNSSTSTTTQYLAQPTTTKINYVPVQQTTQYVPKSTISNVAGSSQGASALNYNYFGVTKVASGTTSNTGKYINYDNNLQSASAYGYNNGGVAGQAYDPNGVTALSMNGSGSFLPSSVFQWFMFILLMLAIVIIVRIIIRKSASNNVHTTPTH